MRRLVMGSALGVVAFSAGCAALGGDDGGSANLPDRGIGGWVRVVDPESPWVIGDLTAPRMAGPSALVVDARVVMILQRETGETATLVRVEGGLDGTSFGAPEALVPPISGREPSLGQASDGTFWLAYEGDDGLAFARSNDARTFSDVASSGVDALAEAPSMVIEGTEVHLWSARDGRLFHQRATLGETLAFDAAVEVFAPGEDCVDRNGEAAPCWDAGGIVDAEVRLATSPTGRKVYRMFYTGSGGRVARLGFAASFDGVTWSRYAFNPVVSPDFEASSATAIFVDPAAAAGSDSVYQIFWAEARTPSIGGIAHATSPADAPADRW